MACILRGPLSIPVAKARGTTKRFCGELSNIIATGGKDHVYTMKINSCPDDVLLEVFDFCRKSHDLYAYGYPPSTWDWLRLAHVCSKWRHIMFASPRRLELRLLCTNGTPVKRNLSCWQPFFLLVIDYSNSRDADDGKSLTPSDEDNILTALEASDRVQYVSISVTSSLLRKMTTETRDPFSALTHIRLSSKDENVSAFPDGFVDRSAPQLRVAHFDRIPFPTFPKLLTSALNLIDLQLINLPPENYIPPEATANCLAAFKELKTLLIGFKSPIRYRKTRCRPPKWRTCLPSLTNFGFHGDADYLEDLVSRIDTPRLGYFRISYFNWPHFRVCQLSNFINRTPSLCWAPFQCARIDFGFNGVYVILYYEQEELLEENHFSLQISCRGLDWQISHVAQTLSQTAALISDVQNLAIEARESNMLSPDGKDLMDGTEWLGLLRLFTAVKTLHVSENLAWYVARGLEGVKEETGPKFCPPSSHFSWKASH